MYVEPISSSLINCDVGSKFSELGFSREQKISSPLLFPFISRVKVARYVRWRNITLAATQGTTNVPTI